MGSTRHERRLMFFHTFSERLEMSFTMLFEADTVFGSLVFRECMHFSRGASYARKVKSHRAQRITESCYFYLQLFLYFMWFSETLFRKYQKVSGVLVAATRDAKDPSFSRLKDRNNVSNNQSSDPTLHRPVQSP